jgi:DnaJ-related protein SCJ1
VDVTDGTVQAQRDKPAGDVVFVVGILEHDNFSRNLEHLYMDWNLTLIEALTGFNHSIKHLDGRNVSITRQEITPPGFKLTLLGQGMPRLVTAEEEAAAGAQGGAAGGGGYGNLVITFSISFPFIPRRSKRIIRRMMENEDSDDESEEGGDDANGGGT